MLLFEYIYIFKVCSPLTMTRIEKKSKNEVETYETSLSDWNFVYEYLNATLNSVSYQHFFRSFCTFCLSRCRLQCKAFCHSFLYERGQGNIMKQYIDEYVSVLFASYFNKKYWTPKMIYYKINIVLDIN
jgi:hypothetical protein